MKKITKEEFQNLPLSRPSMAQEFKDAILDLKKGEGFSFERDEWKMRSSPADFFSAFGSKFDMKLSVRILADRTGWAVLRVE